MSDILAAYADGGCIGRNPSADGGTWAFVLVSLDGAAVRTESGVLLPADVGLPAVTNNVTEFYALWKALQALPDGWEGEVLSDSNVSLGRLFRGWRDEGLPSGWLVDALAERQRLGRLRPVLLDGHPTREQLAWGVGKRGNPVSRWNMECDRLCCEAAERFLKRRKLQQWAAAGR